jgi:hypothetical protein
MTKVMKPKDGVKMREKDGCMCRVTDGGGAR